MSSAIAVIDFETTGMTPTQGARATEVAIVLLEQGRVVDRFQSLMQTGAWVSPFITDLTGITNEMLRTAPPAAEVMRDAAKPVERAVQVCFIAHGLKRVCDQCTNIAESVVFTREGACSRHRCD